MTALYVKKLLTAIVMPLGLVSTLIVLALVLRIARRRRAARSLIAAAMAILWLGSLPAVSNALIASLENRFAVIPMARAPRVDVIVVLGGAVEPASAPRVLPELKDAVDRLTYASRLYAAGVAPLILVSGGSFDWHQNEPSEAELMTEVLGWLGVPAAAVILESQSRTTEENAIQTARIWRARGFATGLLVTSAFHMARADLEFRGQGLVLTPAPTDIWVSTHQERDILAWFPSAGALNQTTYAVKEYIGLAVLRSGVFAIRKGQ